MAVATTNISPPDVRALALPILSALPAAAASTQPATTILPTLSPILRQRVQLLSGASTDPWIRLLTYDTSKVPKLTEIALSGSLEPHPVSGEVEIDWDYNVQIRYRRLDQETMQTLVVLGEFDLFFRLVYCTGDKEGGGDGNGWRVGEVGVASNPSPLDSFGGFSDIAEAEKAFQQAQTSVTASSRGVNGLQSSNNNFSRGALEEEDDDDDYWGRYDATPARTPANNRSPAPQSMTTAAAQTNNQQHNPYLRSTSAEDAYYAQYDSVQPAMDPHDPDEEVPGVNDHTSAAPPPLGLARPVPQRASDSGSGSSPGQQQNDLIGGAWTMAEPPRSPSERSVRAEEEARAAGLVHPRPESSASSNGSLTVAKLEESAEKREQGEFGVKQHISRSIRSLFLLSRSSGIDREEFERMVRTELDVLAMMDDDESL